MVSVAAAALLLPATPLFGQTITQDEALALAFPAATLERRTAYLDDAQLTSAATLAGDGVPIESGVISYYVALESGAPVGLAYFDAHRVRTLPEVLMIVVGADDRVRRVETVRFREPPEYRAPDGWLRLFDDRVLDGDLSLRAGIPNMTGATLTSRAVTAAVRRVLALHAVIDPLGRSGERRP